MSAAELRITYRPDDDGTGQIVGTAQSGEFFAQGAAWFDATHVKETFVASLRAFPFTSADPPMIEGGFGSREIRGSLEQCHLRITIKPYNTRGTLLVHVYLASPSWKSPDVDLQNSATIRFLTEYEAVNKFANEIGDVVDGVKEQAILVGTTA
jgi:hypothetical protein